MSDNTDEPLPEIQPRRHKRRKRNVSRETCMVCGMPLILEGGYANTLMCGPCATGEAATLDELGDTW